MPVFLGAQLRYTVPSSGSDLWFGGEASYVRRWTSYDIEGVDTEGRNGWTLAGLVGKPLGETGLGTWHVYAAAGLNKYGGAGFYGHIGIDLQR